MQPEIIDRVCRWCGKECEDDRNLAGPGWVCHYCGHSQTFGPCPLCGQLASANKIDEGQERLRKQRLVRAVDKVSAQRRKLP